MCGCVCVGVCGCVCVCVCVRKREFTGEFYLEELPEITYHIYKNILGEL